MKIVIESEVDPVAGLLWYWSVVRENTDEPEWHWCCSAREAAESALEELDNKRKELKK